MKALTILPEFAMNIALGEKTVEVRTWKTNYRGPLLITSSARKRKGLIAGYALCTVDLVDVVPMTPALAEKALMKWEPGLRNSFAWILDENNLIIPQPVKGRLSLWECDCPIIYPDFEQVEEKDGIITLDTGDFFEKYWDPITC